jgi:hypothetical protein
VADLDLLRAGGWEDVLLTERVERYPSMLMFDERRLLHWLARDVWEGTGAIVDAGCFLGGSTAALASGVRARPRERRSSPGPTIVTYDRFVIEQYTIDAGFFERWPELCEGDGFRQLFDQFLGPLAGEVVVREGDITAEAWDRGPIEILFLDVLKTWRINDHVLRTFLTHLVPGRSVIVHQDFVQGMFPWIPISMELLADVTEQVADVSPSRVFAVTGEITEERLDEILPLNKRVPPELQVELIDRVISAASGGESGQLLLAKANLLRMRGATVGAAAVLEEVERMYEDHIPTRVDAQATRRALEAAIRDRAAGRSVEQLA